MSLKRRQRFRDILYGNTAQFGKKSQPEFLSQFKVPKMEEYCMYFPFLELRKWGKKTAETRRRNCAALPYKTTGSSPLCLSARAVR